MTFKISGLDKLQKQLEQARRAFRSLDGDIATLRFDPSEPASIQAAVEQMESTINRKIAPYRGNETVDAAARQMKESYRKQIVERAAQDRLERESSGAVKSQTLPTTLRQIENTVSDLRWAGHSSFVRHIKKLARQLHDVELDSVTQALSDGIDLDGWLDENGANDHSGMLGSAVLEWPEDPKAELGLVILLIDRFAENPDAASDFADTFYYRANNSTQNLQNMTAQMIVPFARDYIEHVKAETAVTEATLPPTRSGPAARKVFVVHGHDEHARESVARFLENLDFEAIILHEQANQGRTIIEKVEAHGDVGFAVVLLTPDDEGAATGKPPQPRARQNVILELGYL